MKTPGSARRAATMFIKEQDLVDISAGQMLQQLPVLKLTGK